MTTSFQVFSNALFTYVIIPRCTVEAVEGAIKCTNISSECYKYDVIK